MIRFEHPTLLFLLLVIPILIIIFVLVRINRKKKIAVFAENHLFGKLSIDTSPSRPITKFVFKMLALLFLIIAIANPKMGSKMVEGERSGVDIAICLDISNSMLAEDIAPNRLAAAKQALSKFIERLTSDRIAIVIFAGRSYIQLPLTSDYGAAKMFIDAISPEMIQVQGTAIGSAIDLTMNALGYNSLSDEWLQNKSRMIIVISDGENHEDDAVASARKAKKEGVIVSTIGLGSTQSVPIPVYRNGRFVEYKQDRNGNPVTTQLNEQMLIEVASAGGGIYVRGNNTNVGVSEIFDKINEMEKNKYGESTFSEYEDQFQWPLLIAFLFLVAELLISEKRSKYFNTVFFFGKKESK